jgi:Fe-S cluster assembly protein SufD
VVEVLHVGSAAACHPRSAILLGEGARASLVESCAGSGTSNAVLTIDLGVGATLHHARLQHAAPDAIRLALTSARLAAAAHYDAFLLVTGAQLSREDLQVALAGAEARLVLHAGWLLRGTQEATIAPLVDHQQPGGRTQELLKGVLADQSHGVFLGNITVREGADGTDARQLNRNLMLSPAARIDSKPELTIHADEVKCSHGATVGDLDEAALFYLQARGIDPATARHLLVEAFAAELLDSAALAPGIDALARHHLQAWLNGTAATP